MGFSLLISFFVLRVVLLARCLSDVGPIAPITLIIGALQDLQVLAVLMVAGALVTFSIFRFKKKMSAQKLLWIDRFFTFLFWYAIIFFSICEFYFWSEFESRFNFIAVDYLVYTTEVFQNIMQSYPVAKILAITFAASLILTFKIQPTINHLQRRIWGRRSMRFILLGILLISLLPFLNPDVFSVKPAAKEVSSAGWKTLIEAFFNNELSYSRFYKTLPDDQIDAQIKKTELAGHIGSEIHSTLPRTKKVNVILVVMESMSRKFMKYGGNDQALTPNLDQLYQNGLSFSQVYATGTRTVRGLEAVDLSVPPTPGQSILRRPGFENLYSLGAILRDVGYESRFLYGGYALFDNMGAFFAANHLKVIDRTDLDKETVQFENAWGVCDEDMFHVAIAEADKISSDHKPFFELIMTTSNHRPYTYPQHIDIPSGESREGAVRYADFAVGELIKEAKTKPWFSDTIFVFVADHNASVAGRTELPLRDFPIPFIIYGPGLVGPQKVDRLASQIDVAPTILDAVGLKYKNHFFGHSLLQPGDARAFVATYQSLGYFKNNILTVLEPKKKVLQFDLKGDEQVQRAQLDNALVVEAISFYQFASARFQKQEMKNGGDNNVTLDAKTH